MQKYWKLLVENRFSKISPKIFRFFKNLEIFAENFPICIGISIVIFRKSENFRRNFRDFWKIWKFWDFFFENRFSTKNFQYFFMIFFKPLLFFPCIRISRLESARKSQGRVRETYVKFKKKKEICSIWPFLDVEIRESALKAAIFWGLPNKKVDQKSVG